MISSKAYKLLGLLRRSFSGSCSIPAKKLLYTSLVRSQLTYCSQLWRPQLLKTMKSLEAIQRRATKYITNDSKSDYRTRLIKLRLLPLMYNLELNDISFFLRCLKDPPLNFNILDYVKFSSGNTRSTSFNKLCHQYTKNNTIRFSYFYRLPGLWNRLPPLDLNLSLTTLKAKVKEHLWNHFIEHFDSNNVCTYHFHCPCTTCYKSPHTANYYQ